MRSAYILVSLLAFAGCGPNPETNGNPSPIVPSDYAAALPKLNDNFVGSMPYLGRSIPLPEGNWTVVATNGIVKKGVGLTVTSVSLVRHDGPVLRGVLFVTENVSPVLGIMPLSEVCTSSDVLWNDVAEAVPGGRQDCAAVTFQRPALWRQMRHTLPYAAINALDLLGILTPNTMVSLHVHEADRSWEVSMTLYTNPDAEGIVPDTATQRASSAWAAVNLPKDRRKQAFVSRLAAQAAALRMGLRQQIDGPPPYVPASGLTPI